MRKLFVAKDQEGNKIHIDAVSTEDRRIFSCPYCNREVIPRLGEIKEKHFSHKDGFCGVELNAQENKKVSEIKLTSFKESDRDPFEKTITPKSLVRCRICGDNLRLENATIVTENTYICKRCVPRIREIL